MLQHNATPGMGRFPEPEFLLSRDLKWPLFCAGRSFYKVSAKLLFPPLPLKAFGVSVAGHGSPAGQGGTHQEQWPRYVQDVGPRAEAGAP